MGATEETLRGSGAIGAAQVEIVHRGECGELAVAEAVAAMMVESQLPVAAFHTGAAALEQVGAVAGNLFEALALGGRQDLEGMIRLTQRFEPLGA